MKSKTTFKYTSIQLKGRIWLPSAIAAMYFLVFPVLGFLTMQSQGNMTGELLLKQYEYIWTEHYLLLGMIIAVISGIASAMEGYAYLYSHKKTVFYHSLPIKRTTLFWKKTGYAVLAYIIPYILMELLAFLPGVSEGMNSAKIRYAAAEMCLLHFCVYLLFYFATVFVILMTGNYLMGILSFVGINLFCPLTGWIIKITKEAFFQTYYYESIGLENKLIEWFSPIFASINFCMDEHKKISAIMGAIIILAGISLLAYVKRPMEKTGNSLIYDWTQGILTVLMDLFGGTIIGLLFYEISMSNGWGIAGIIIGTTAVHCIVQIILNMNFQKLFSKSLLGGITLIGIVLLGGILRYDLIGFETYLPEYEKLDSIYIYSTLGVFNPIIEKKEDGSIREISPYSNEYLQHCDMGKDKELYSFLETLIESQEIKDENVVGQYYVMYKLNSGKTIYRQYANRGTDKEFIDCIKTKDTFKTLTVSFMDSVDMEYLDRIQCFVPGHDQTSNIIVSDQEEMKLLLEALYQDLNNVTGETYEASKLAVVELRYRFSDEIFQDRSFYAAVDIYPDYENLIALIEKESPEFFNVKYEGLG